MNDTNSYIVQCNRDNFDDVRYLMQIFANILDIDSEKYTIKVLSLDSIMKQKLSNIGAGFWEETEVSISRELA